MDTMDELLDRFGELPKPVENLLLVARLKMTGHKAYATDINVHKDGFTIDIHPNADINVSAVPELITAERGKLKFVSGMKPKFVYAERGVLHADAFVMLSKAQELLKALVKKNSGK